VKKVKDIIGWKEWLTLPDLGIKGIKAKIDTGARTSALHTYGLEPFEVNGRPMIKFGVHPLQNRDDIEVRCIADVVDRRRVTSSGGQSEMRYVIATAIVLGELRWPIELTLTNRTAMRFRMLLGRAAISGRMVVDPAKAYLTGRGLSRGYSKSKKKRKRMK